MFLYKAIDYDGLECPNNSPVGCAASVAGFITSISWIASYLSFAANACGNAVNNGALCAGDFTALMANFGEIATVGAAARADCNFGKNALQILTRTETISPPWKEFVPAGASPAVDKALKIKGHKDQQRNRDYDIVQCAVDVTNSASYIVRVILQIRAAGSACADPKSCAVGIMNIISSFAWISQFTALAVSDCQVGADQKAGSGPIHRVLMLVSDDCIFVPSWWLVSFKHVSSNSGSVHSRHLRHGGRSHQRPGCRHCLYLGLC